MKKTIDNAFASTYTVKGACECIVFFRCYEKNIDAHAETDKDVAVQRFGGARICVAYFIRLFNNSGGEKECQHLTS